MMTVSEEKHPAKAYASQGAGVTISLSNVLSGDDEWEKQYTPYVETLQSYVSDLQ